MDNANVLNVMNILFYLKYMWERSGSVVECLIRDPGVVGMRLTGFATLCP